MPKLGHGTTLKVKTGEATTSTIGRITALAGPNLSTDIVETTAMDSTNAFKEFIKGLKDWGEMTFTTNAEPDADGDTTNYYDLLLDEANSGVANEWTVTFPNATTLTFDALLSGFSINANPGDVISTDCTLKITGDIVWA